VDLPIQNSLEKEYQKILHQNEGNFELNKNVVDKLLATMVKGEETKKLPKKTSKSHISTQFETASTQNSNQGNSSFPSPSMNPSLLPYSIIQPSGNSLTQKSKKNDSSVIDSQPTFPFPFPLPLSQKKEEDSISVSTLNTTSLTNLPSTSLSSERPPSQNDQQTQTQQTQLNPNEPGLIKSREPIRISMDFDESILTERVEFEENSHYFKRQYENFVLNSEIKFTEQLDETDLDLVDEFEIGKAEDMKNLGIIITQLYISPQKRMNFSPSVLKRDSSILLEVQKKKTISQKTIRQTT